MPIYMPIKVVLTKGILPNKHLKLCKRKPKGIKK